MRERVEAKPGDMKLVVWEVEGRVIPLFNSPFGKGRDTRLAVYSVDLQIGEGVGGGHPDSLRSYGIKTLAFLPMKDRQRER